MKKIITVSVFVFASILGFAQYNHVQLAPNGTVIEEGQYNANPGVLPNDSKETFAQKMALVHKTGSWKYYYDSGTLLAEEFYTSAGGATGIWKTYHSNSTLSSIVNYSSMTAIYYHQNGSKAEEGTINLAKQRTGSWTGWHDNGKINYTGAWNSNGAKNGDWKFYDRAEQLVGTERWNNGVLAR